MKTIEQIKEKIKEWSKNDLFGFKTTDLLMFLPFDDVKEHLKEGTQESDWKQQELSRESVLKTMQEYMEFAWEKANNCRGLSAGRSMAHYTAWIWLIGDEEHFGDLESYNYYGKDNLVAICNHYGWDSKQWDDGERVN